MGHGARANVLRFDRQETFFEDRLDRPGSLVVEWARSVYIQRCGTGRDAVGVYDRDGMAARCEADRFDQQPSRAVAFYRYGGLINDDDGGRVKVLTGDDQLLRTDLILHDADVRDRLGTDYKDMKAQGRGSPRGL